MVKKIFLGLVLISFFGFIFPVQAATPTATTVDGVLRGCTIPAGHPALLDNCDEECKFEDNEKCGVCCLLLVLYNITDWIFVILVGLSVLFVIIGAMNLLMSAGDSAKIKSGKDYIMYAAIGLIVGLLARAIPAIVKLAVGA